MSSSGMREGEASVSGETWPGWLPWQRSLRSSNAARAMRRPDATTAICL